MSDMFFNKNRFNNVEPTKLATQIVKDPNKLGRRTVEEVKNSMHPFKEPKHIEPPKVSKQVNQNTQVNSLNAFNEWNRNK